MFKNQKGPTLKGGGEQSNNRPTHSITHLHHSMKVYNIQYASYYVGTYETSKPFEHVWWAILLKTLC